MESVDLAKILKEFDKHIKDTIAKRQDPDQSINIRPDKSVQSYLDGMQKRMKLRTSNSTHKFQKLLQPMKRLKSFVSIKDFIQGLPHLSSQGKDDSCHVEYQVPKRNIKIQYEDLRGGYYMEKIEKHLKSHKMERRLDRKSLKLLKALEAQPSEGNEQLKWMSTTLNNISVDAQETALFSATQVPLDQENQMPQYQEFYSKKAEEDRSKKGRKISARMSNIYKSEANFSRVSSVLSSRLKKILVNKYVCVGKRDTNADKKRKQIIRNLQRQSHEATSKPQTAKIHTRSHFSQSTRFPRAGTAKECINPKADYMHRINNILEMADENEQSDENRVQNGRISHNHSRKEFCF